MPAKTTVICVLLSTFLVTAATVHADDNRSPRDKRWWQAEWKAEYLDGLCQVKSESKRDEFKEEIKCERHR